MTSKQRNGLRKSGAKKVHSLSIYDPAEDLGSDESIAVFMAEALGTNDAAYISHALGGGACKGNGCDCGADGDVAGAALSFLQQQRESDAEDNACGDEGAGD